MRNAMGSPQDQPLDPAVIEADELLLDALGRGEPAGAVDEIGALLAVWRTDLAAEPPQNPASDVPDESVIGALAIPGPRAPLPPTKTPPTRTSSAKTPPRSTRASWRARVAVAAATVALLGGGTVAAAATATPGDPLWPIAQVFYPARADRVAAEDALTQARRAIANGRLDQAQHLLDRAAQLIAKVRDQRQAAHLRDELEQIRQLLNGVLPPNGLLPSPSSPSATTGPSPAPAPTGISGSPTSSSTRPSSPSPGTSLVPGSSLLPQSPLQSLLPSISIVPSLPLPGLGG